MQDSMATSLFERVSLTRPDWSCTIHALPKNALGNSAWVLGGFYTAWCSIRPTHAACFLRHNTLTSNYYNFIRVASWRWVDSMSVGLQSSKKTHWIAEWDLLLAPKKNVALESTNCTKIFPFNWLLPSDTCKRKTDSPKIDQALLKNLSCRSR